MAKLTLTDFASLTNEQSAITILNANSALTETALENTLSRDGTSPNTMSADLDMNANQILNLPSPTTSTEPLRLQDLTDFLGDGLTIPDTASELAFVPTGTIIATNVQAAIAEVALEAAGGVPDGDKGDIVVTSAGAVWTVDPVTGSGSFVRATSPTLVTPVLGTPASGVLTNVTGLTTAGLVDDAVTYAKMQNVSAATRLLGRGSAGGAGNTEELTVGTGLSLSGTELSATGSAGSGAVRNRLNNGDFTIWQRGTSFTSATTPVNNDDQYLADQWVLLTDGADTVDVTRETSAIPTGGLYAIALDVETVNKKFGVFQVIEQRNCIDCIGSNVVVSFKAKVSATTNLNNLKCAIVAWDGTADTVTSDIVSIWNGGGTNPTLVANWTYENTPANLNPTTSYATYSVTANVDTASTKNIGVFIWSDVTTTTVGGADILYITDVQLETGTTASTFSRKSYQDELEQCVRHYYRRNSGTSVEALNIMHAWATTQAWGKFFDYPAEMRINPTAAISNVGHVQLWTASAGAAHDVTNINFTASRFSCNSGVITIGSSALVIGDATMCSWKTGGTGYFEASAEL